ncbi:MAG: hypothetical protein ACFFCO_10795 [Promethearchaeota archaeon]
MALCFSCTDWVILTDGLGRRETVSWERFAAESRAQRFAARRWRR